METDLLAIVRFWHFHCPECGVGDHELGRLGEAHEVHCVVCLVELDRPIRLRRWPADEATHAAAERAVAGSRQA